MHPGHHRRLLSAPLLLHTHWKALIAGIKNVNEWPIPAEVKQVMFPPFQYWLSFLIIIAWADAILGIILWLSMIS